MLQPLPVVHSCSHPTKQPDDIEQDDEVQDSDQQQEDPGYSSPNQRTDVLHLPVAADDIGDHELCGDAEQQRDQEHDARVAQREEEPDPERLLPFLQQLTGGVVDRRDVVGIKGMP